MGSELIEAEEKSCQAAATAACSCCMLLQFTPPAGHDKTVLSLSCRGHVSCSDFKFCRWQSWVVGNPVHTAEADTTQTRQFLSCLAWRCELASRVWQPDGEIGQQQWFLSGRTASRRISCHSYTWPESSTKHWHRLEAVRLRVDTTSLKLLQAHYSAMNTVRASNDAKLQCFYLSESRIHRLPMRLINQLQNIKKKDRCSCCARN